MRLLAGLLLCLPLLVHAGHYECKDAAGNLSYQLAPCKSQESRYIKDDAPPVSRRVDRHGQSLTTQVVKSGNAFSKQGAINDTMTKMTVDAGLPYVVANRDFALMAGLPSRGRNLIVRSSTGSFYGYLVTARSVWFAGHEVKNVPVVVQTLGPIQYPNVVIGMSFLSHFDMNINGDVLTLHRK